VPRLPMSGSELSLSNPYQHAVLCDHGELASSIYPVPSLTTQPSSLEKRFGILNISIIHFKWERITWLTVCFCYGPLTCLPL
jgi:hypothetical protein